MGSRTAPQRRRRIVVGGPLAPFADSLRRDLAGQGYARTRSAITCICWRI